MIRIDESILKDLHAKRDTLVTQMLQTMYKKSPELRHRYEVFEETVRNDYLYHLDFLLEALRYGSHRLFEDYLYWNRAFFEGIDIPLDHVAYSFRVVQEVLRKFLPENDRVLFDHYFMNVDMILGDHIESGDSFISGDDDISQLTREYFRTVLRGTRMEAMEIINRAIDEGVTIDNIYLEVFQRSLREVGRLWQIKKLTVAEEHYFTAATQLIMSNLYPKIFTGAKKDVKLVAACIGNELHEIGIRMVADFFEMNGWNTFYYGANTPIPSLINMVDELRPELLALSATLLPHVEHIEKIIGNIRESNKGVKVLVGGYPFNVDKELWQKIGADGSAGDAREALVVAEDLVPVS